MKILKSISLAVAAIAFTTTAFAQDKASGTTQHGSPMGSMGSGAMHGNPNASKAPYDLQFLDTMAMHHQNALDMAQLAESRASHDELKKMAKQMIDDQQQEIKQMQAWKQQWYPGQGDAVNMQMAGMKASMKGMEKEMQKLSASKGKEFDRMFIDMMTKHHQGAVAMARTALSKAEHPEIKQMAQKIIGSQQEEIAQMTSWKKEWQSSGK